MHEQSEEFLSVEVWDRNNPKEFFLAIKKLMGSQCDDNCTSQFFMVTQLCPVYKITDTDCGPDPDLSYHKFSDKFMAEMAGVKAETFC